MIIRSASRTGRDVLGSQSVVLRYAEAPEDTSDNATPGTPEELPELLEVMPLWQVVRVYRTSLAVMVEKLAVAGCQPSSWSTWRRVRRNNVIDRWRRTGVPKQVVLWKLLMQTYAAGAAVLDKRLLDGGWLMLVLTLVACDHQ